MSGGPTWPAPDLRSWLARHAESLEPGLRLGEGGPPLDLPLEAALAGPDPLGRPCLLFLFEQQPESSLAEGLLDAAARLREARPALEAWYARPEQPRLMVVAPGYPLELRRRLGLIAGGCGLLAWSVHAPAEDSEEPAFRLEFPPPLRLPSAEGPAAPVRLQELQRRLLRHAGRVRPELSVHGAGWPLHFCSEHGVLAVLHRDGDELLFVGRRPGARAEVLRLDDEESVDRALDALLRAQYAQAIQA